ncbi:MAG: zinc ribbon domain-containing protein [Thermoleophilia bacterium]
MTRRIGGRSSRKWSLVGALVLVGAAVLLLGTGPAAWAGDLSVSTMKISIWPEYDDPRVLVIYQGDLDESVQLPADVTFNLPKGAEVGMACEVDPSGGHSCRPFKLADRGEYQSLTYRVEAQRKIFFEYYYEAFPAGVPARSFDVSLLPAFPVAELTVEVQEPARSTDFAVTPALPEQITDSEGLVYHQQVFTAPPVGGPIDLSIAYSKQDDKPSVSPSSEAGTDGAATVGAQGGGSRSLIVVVIVVGLAALGLVGFRAFKPASATPRGKGGASRGGRQGGSGSGGSRQQPASRARGTKFCTDCGAGLNREHRFCPECGHEQA